MHRFIIFTLALVVATPCASETLDNDKVIALLAAGLGDEVVIAKINSSTPAFDTSTEQILDLKGKGISGAVIAAMIAATSAPAKVEMSLDSPDPMVPHPSGIYLAGSTKMIRIESTTSRQARTSGMLGAVLTGGLTGMRVKAAINGPKASIVVNEPMPVFYFYFDQNAQGLGTVGGAVTSPNEFSLIRFEEKKDKREAVIGSVGLAGTKSGLRDKDQIDFSANQISPSVYKVVPTVSMKPGQYGFVSGGVGSGANATFRVFDFAIPEVKK